MGRIQLSSRDPGEHVYVIQLQSRPSSEPRRSGELPARQSSACRYPPAREDGHTSRPPRKGTVDPLCSEPSHASSLFLAASNLYFLPRSDPNYKHPAFLCCVRSSRELMNLNRKGEPRVGARWLGLRMAPEPRTVPLTCKVWPDSG